MLFPIAELIEGRKLITVNQNDSVRNALRTMIENDFSQLPVVDDQGNLCGVISEQVIVRKYYHFDGDKILITLKVKDCQMKPLTLPITADIFDALTPLEKDSAVIIVNDLKPVSILTDYDTTHFFHSYSQGIILCQDIEFSIRRQIESVFPVDSAEMTSALIAAVGPNRDTRYQGRPSREYSELTLWDHVQLITTDANWPKFNGVLEPKALFQKFMEPVRKARNQIAHFRGELSKVQLDALSHAKYWLENRPVASSLSTNQPQVEDVVVIVNSLDLNIDSSPVTTSNGDSSESILSQELINELNLENEGGFDAVSSDISAIYGNNEGVNSGFEATHANFGLDPNGKYAALYNWLLLQAKTKEHIRTSFEDIEKLLKEPLPPSAREHHSWWANENSKNRQSTAWLKAGWRVEDVNFKEGTVVFRRRYASYMKDFFTDVLVRLKAARPGITQANRPSLQNWFDFGAGRTGFRFSWVFGHETLRVELYIDTRDQAKNKAAFAALEKQRDEIEKEIGARLTWEELPNKQASRISLKISAMITDPPEKLEQHKIWVLETTFKFVDAFQERIKDLSL